MDKKKIIILSFIVLVLILISIIVIMISNNNSNDNDDPNIIIPDDYVVSNRIITLKTDICFDLQKTILNYYDKLMQQDYDYIYKVLDDDYKNALDITKENIKEKIDKIYYSDSYVIDSVLYNDDELINYYFINGFLITQSSHYEAGEIINAKFLIIVKNNEFLIRPIDNNIKLDEFASNYSFVDKDINSNEYITRNNMTEKNKLLYYIANFINIARTDRRMAYEYLGEKTKQKYSLESFMEMEINLTPTIFAFAKENVGYDVLYTIKDNSQNTIEIIEEYPSKYKIDF